MGPQSKSGDRLFGDLRKSEDGTEYLRRIKEFSSEPTRPAPTPAPAEPSPNLSHSASERRRSPRFHCCGSAQFRAEGSETRMWGTFSDVSLHGCYVEMNNTFPVDTKVSLVLEAMGIRVLTQAVVRVSYPFLGMGLAFLKIEPGQLQQLKRMLASLSTQASPSNTPPKEVAGSASTHSLADVDPRVMLDALTEFFRTNALLSRQEFYVIAKRARR